MVLNLRPKCANPHCAAAFEWLAGGKLFRFDRHTGQIMRAGEIDATGAGLHAIGHFWLCERCSNIYTLRFEAGQGVVIRPLWSELPAAKSSMPLPAS